MDKDYYNKKIIDRKIDKKRIDRKRSAEAASSFRKYRFYFNIQKEYIDENFLYWKKMEEKLCDKLDNRGFQNFFN